VSAGPVYDSSFYDQAWENWNDMIRFSPAPRVRREKLRSWIRRLPAQSLLDAGCGNAQFLSEMAADRGGLQLAGADISPAVIAENRKQFPQMEFFELDIDGHSLPRRFDVVVCMEVLEHCPDPHRALTALARMTGKWLLLTVPCGPVFEIDRRCGHVRHFSCHQMREALVAAGLKAERIEAWGFPFYNLYKHAINLWPDRICRSFLSARTYGWRERLIARATYCAFRLCLPFRGYQMFVLASKTPGAANEQAG